MKQVVWMALAGCLGLAGCGGNGARFHVAPDGRDDNSGTRDQPFATLERARDAVRELKGAGTADKPVTVLIHGGIHVLRETLVFTPEDSGTKEAPVTYAAQPGAKPVISGGMRITGWRNEGGVAVAAVPGVKEGERYYKSLYVNGRRAVRAREPHGGFFRIRDVLEPALQKNSKKDNRRIDINRQGFVFDGEDLKPWPDLADAVVVRYAAWETSLNWIQSVDVERRRVMFTDPKGWVLGTQEHHDPKGDRYFVENIREALDEPGEWYLDRGTGEARYLLRTGETAESLDAVAGVAERLIGILAGVGDPRVAGDGGTYDRAPFTDVAPNSPGLRARRLQAPPLSSPNNRTQNAARP
jgi:hypothetical protein